MAQDADDVATVTSHVREVYEEIALEYDSRIPGETPADASFTQTEMEFVLGKINESDRVLDAGCGTGRFTIPLAARVQEIHGVDLSNAMLRVAEEAAAKAAVEVELHEADMTDLPFEDASFDVVMSMLALMHIAPTERQPAFLEFARVLRPGGRVLVGVKNSLFELLAKVDRFASVDVTDFENKQLIFTNTHVGRDLEAPWHSFSPQDLSRLFAIGGLTLVDLRGNIPLGAWLDDAVLADAGVSAVIRTVERIVGGTPPFNYFGYHLLAEAVKPVVPTK